MKFDQIQLEQAYMLAENLLTTLVVSQDLRRRWINALKKALSRLQTQPFFAWQPSRLLIVSVPTRKTEESGCRFYLATGNLCRRIDKTGLCQAFFEGYPCWHRAAFMLLTIYFGEIPELNFERVINKAERIRLSTKVDTSG